LETDSVFDGKERPVDPASITVIRIVALGWVLGIAAINALGLILAWLLADDARSWITWALLILAVIAGSLSLFSYWWPAVRYRYLRYRVDENGLVIRRGVLWRSITSIPLSRVQHTDVSQGPLQRSHALATLVVHTAGTDSASIPLGGLQHSVALRLRDHLVSSDEADAV
jgi:membrane protein YdbS with pleckstrin-like domain